MSDAPITTPYAPPGKNGQSGRKTIRTALLILALALVGAAVWLSLTSAKAAPQLNLTTITGESVSSASLKGKVTIVNFWATSCTTCVKEMPMLVETYQKFQPRGLELVAVAMSYDPANYVINFTQTRQLPFKVAVDARGEIAQSFGDVKLTPTTYVISKDGRILKRYVGEPDVAEFHRLIETALKA